MTLKSWLAKSAEHLGFWMCGGAIAFIIALCFGVLVLYHQGWFR